MDGDRVMIRRIIFILDILVKLLIMKSHNIKSLSKRMILVTFDGVVHLQICRKLMCCLKWNHNQRNILLDLENPLESSRIAVNVELGSRCYVSSFNCSSHHHYPLYLALHRRKCHKQKCQIGQRTSIYPNHMSLVCHYTVVYLCKVVLVRHLLW